MYRVFVEKEKREKKKVTIVVKREYRSTEFRALICEFQGGWKGLLEVKTVKEERVAIRGILGM